MAGYIAANRPFEATIALESLIQRDPTDDAARLQLARLKLASGRYRDAHSIVCHDISWSRPDDAVASDRLAALRVLTEHGRMASFASALGDPSTLSLATLADGGQALAAIGATDLALEWFRQARRKAPEEPAVLVRSAMLALDLGQTDPALQWLEQVIKSHDLPMAHWLLANARGWHDTHHVDRLRARLANARDPRDLGYLGYALHKELDDLGDFEPAWDALAAAARTWRSMLDYRMQDATALFARLRGLAMPAPTGAAEAGAMAKPSHASSQPGIPIFIVGLHRSGTTLLERMLAAHPEVAIGGESMRFTAQLRLAADHHCRDVIDSVIVERAAGFDWDAIGSGFIEASRWFTAGRRWFTEKQPGCALALPLIRRALPQARIIHVRRDPMQVGWSMLRELFTGACPYSYDMAELGHWIANQRQLLQHWIAEGDPAVLEIDYADLVSQPIETARKVYAHCGLDWRDDACAVEQRDGRVATASAAQARQPVHTRSLERWRPYAERLEPLRAALAEHGMPDGHRDHRLSGGGPG